MKKKPLVSSHPHACPPPPHHRCRASSCSCKKRHASMMDTAMGVYGRQPAATSRSHLRVERPQKVPRLPRVCRSSRPKLATSTPAFEFEPQYAVAQVAPRSHSERKSGRQPAPTTKPNESKQTKTGPAPSHAYKTQCKKREPPFGAFLTCTCVAVAWFFLPSGGRAMRARGARVTCRHCAISGYSGRVLMVLGATNKFSRGGEGSGKGERGLGRACCCRRCRSSRCRKKKPAPSAV